MTKKQSKISLNISIFDFVSQKNNEYINQLGFVISAFYVETFYKNYAFWKSFLISFLLDLATITFRRFIMLTK